jgi:hypothetical protein
MVRTELHMTTSVIAYISTKIHDLQMHNVKSIPVQ